jgi:GT2 family glycosyltransferase
MPFISICIPTYNSGEKLVRLLKSIEQQTFTNFEIVISDDSNNHDIHNLINTTFKHLNIFYWSIKPPKFIINN